MVEKKMGNRSMNYRDYMGDNNGRKRSGLVKSAIEMYGKSRAMLVLAANVGFAHALSTGDTRVLSSLLEDMGSRSQTRHRIAAWAREFGRCDVEGEEKQIITARINKKDGRVEVVLAPKWSSITTQEQRDAMVSNAVSTPYYELDNIVPNKAPFELDAAVLSFLTRAYENGATTEQVKAAIEKQRGAAAEKAQKKLAAG